MINPDHYSQRVKAYFSFLTTECKLPIIEEKYNGNAFYDIKYGDREKVVSINYENIEDYFQVIVFKLQNGEMPDYDDKTKTLHLEQLTKMISPTLSKNEILTSNEYFSDFACSNDFEKKLLKSAKDLRLCMQHLDNNTPS